MRADMRIQFGRSLEGFTLIELVVSLGLTVLIASAVAAASGPLLDSWSRMADSAVLEARARSIFNRLADDLDSLIDPEADGTWFAVSVQMGEGNSGLWVESPREKPAETSFVPNAESTDDLRFGQSGAWLRFFCRAESGNLGPVAVAYRMVRRAGTRSPVAGYRLFRSVVRSGNANGRLGVLECGYDLSADSYEQVSAGNDGSVPGDPVSLRIPDVMAGAIAEGVIEFGVRILARDDHQGLRVVFPVDGNEREFHATGGEGAGFDRVELFVRLLTDEGIRQIARLENEGSITRPIEYDDDGAQWWGAALRYSRVFRRSIAISARTP